MIDFVLRPSIPSDTSFIYDAWMKNAERSPLAWYIPKKIFRAQYHELIRQTLTRSQITVAVNPEDTTHIFGFIVYAQEPLYLHFLYTKDLFRRNGIAKSLLLSAAPTLADPETPSVCCSYSGKDNTFAFLRSHYPALTYTPFNLWRSYQ